MITLSNDFGRFYMPKITLMNILCLKSAFGGSALQEDMWVQNDDGISAVIARNGGRLYICSDGRNIEEIAEFINIIGYGEVFTEKDTAEVLGLTVTKEFNVLHKRCKKSADFAPLAVSLKSVYEGLNMGTDSDIALAPFPDFAPDLSHRLRHGGAATVADERGAAMAFLCPAGGIINGIAVDKAYRGQGIGSRLLFKICSYIEGDVFVCTSDENKEFYIKNGFSLIEKAVIAR